MSSADNTKDLDVVVVGGGLAGLTVANLVADAGHRVEVVESRPSPGGRGRSDTRQGYTFNQGAHALYRGGAALRVLARLGLHPRGGVPPTTAMVTAGGDLTPGPSGPLSLLRTRAVPFRAKPRFARVFAGLGRIDPASVAHLTVDQWLDELVTDTASRDLLAALVRLTTYVDQPDQLSADVAVTQMKAAFDYGVLYLDGGWQQLVDALTGRLEATGIGRVRCGIRLDEPPPARIAVLATGTPASTGRLLGMTANEVERRWHPGPPGRAAGLDLGTRRRPRHNLVLGVAEHAYVSNHSAVAVRLAPTARWHVTGVQYLSQGATGERSRLENLVRRVGIEPDEADEARYLHDMTTVSAIATASAGGLAGRPSVTDTGRGEVLMVGDWIGAEGHLLDASLASAEVAAETVIRRLGQRSAYLGATAQ